MFKLLYPSNSARWPNDLEFSSWEEYWKTLGYLSNPKIHSLYQVEDEIKNNDTFDLVIKYEYNKESNSYSNTGRIYYYGGSRDDNWFRNNFPDLYSVAKDAHSYGAPLKFRINRKEFIETLEQDLGFIRVNEDGVRDATIIPQQDSVALIQARAHPDFDITSWENGWDLGEL